MNDELIRRLADKLTPSEMDELEVLLQAEAGDVLTFIVYDAATKEESRRTVKLHRDYEDDRGLMDGLGLIREIVFDL